MQSSINAAVRRRDSVLASAATSASIATEIPATEPASSNVANATPDSASASEPSVTASPSTSQTVSQSIAQSVIAASATTQPQHTGPLNSDMSKLAAALGAGAGNSNNPIVVTLAERV